MQRVGIRFLLHDVIHWITATSYDKKVYQFPSIGPQDIEHKQSFNINQGPQNERKILFNHLNLHLVNINACTKFDRNPQINSQDIEHKQNSIKGHNSLKNWPKIMCIRNTMDLVYINAYTKFYQNSSICSEDIEEKNIFLHQSRAISLLFINKFSPFAIPNHSPDINAHAKFEENWSKTTQVKVQKRSADGWTDTPTVWRV